MEVYSFSADAVLEDNRKTMMSKRLCDLHCSRAIIVFWTEPLLFCRRQIVLGGIAPIAILGKVAPMTVDIQVLGDTCKDPLLITASLFQLQDISHPAYIDQHCPFLATLPGADVYRGLPIIVGVMLDNIADLEHRDLIPPQARSLQEVQQVWPVLGLKVPIMRFWSSRPGDIAAQAHWQLYPVGKLAVAKEHAPGPANRFEC